MGTSSRLCLVLVLLAAGAPLRAQQADYFVSPLGDDRWSGTKADPSADRTDGPFATLARAQAAVRQAKPNAKGGRPITVLMRGGRHQLADPVRFGPEDSGTA